MLAATATRASLEVHNIRQQELVTEFPSASGAVHAVATGDDYFLAAASEGEAQGEAQAESGGASAAAVATGSAAGGAAAGGAAGAVAAGGEMEGAEEGAEEVA